MKTYERIAGGRLGGLLTYPGSRITAGRFIASNSDSDSNLSPAAGMSATPSSSYFSSSSSSFQYEADNDLTMNTTNTTTTSGLLMPMAYQQTSSLGEGITEQQQQHNQLMGSSSPSQQPLPAPLPNFIPTLSDPTNMTLNKMMKENELDSIVNVTRQFPLDYAIVMFGYLLPFVLVVTIITNLLVVFVLYQRHMRTPTNIVLFTMAIVDLCTLLWPSPWYLYIYTFGNHDKFLYPAISCYAHHMMTDVIPVFFHTSSIWLALLLASQRYIYVCHPTLARTWCTVPRVNRAIFWILAVAFAHQLPRFFDNTFETTSIEYNNVQHLACRNSVARWVESIPAPLYFTIYFTFRIVFVFIIPCFALITLNVLLFRALKRAENKRCQLLKTKYKMADADPLHHHHHHHLNDHQSFSPTSAYNLADGVGSNYNLGTSNANLTLGRPTIIEGQKLVKDGDDDDDGEEEDDGQEEGGGGARGGERGAVGGELNAGGNTASDSQSSHASDDTTSQVSPLDPSDPPKCNHLARGNKTNIRRHDNSNNSNSIKVSEHSDQAASRSSGSSGHKDEEQRASRVIRQTGGGVDRSGASARATCAWQGSETQRGSLEGGRSSGSSASGSAGASSSRTSGSSGTSSKGGEEDHASSCLECAAAYKREEEEEAAAAAAAQVGGRASAGRRCSMNAEDGQQQTPPPPPGGATSCEHNHQRNVLQHQPTSQCSSILGGVTNTEDISSSCATTQNAAGSTPFGRADEATLDIIEASSCAQDDEADQADNVEEELSINCDDGDEDDERPTQGDVRMIMGDKMRLGSDQNCQAASACGGGGGGCGGGSAPLVVSQVAKSGSTDSRLACGCFLAHTNALRRSRLMSSESRQRHATSPPEDQLKDGAREACPQVVGCGHGVGEAHSGRCVKCGGQIDERPEVGMCESSKSKGSLKIMNSTSLLLGFDDTRHHQDGNKQQQQQQQLQLQLQSKQQRAVTRDSGKGSPRQERAASQCPTTLAACHLSTGQPSATATTTTTLYSAHTNSTGSLLQVHSSHLPQSQLHHNLNLNPHSHHLSTCNSEPAGARVSYQQQRMKSPSYASCTTGRGSRSTLLGSHAIPMIVANQSQQTTITTTHTTHNNNNIQATISSTSRTMDSNRTTLMLVVVVTVFLTVEIPAAVVTIVHVVHNLFSLSSPLLIAWLEYIKMFTNFFIMISYSVNFTIYCSMSKKFRETFRDLFLCGRGAKCRNAKRLLYQSQQAQSQYEPYTQVHQFALPQASSVVANNNNNNNQNNSQNNYQQPQLHHHQHHQHHHSNLAMGGGSGANLLVGAATLRAGTNGKSCEFLSLSNNNDKNSPDGHQQPVSSARVPECEV